MSLKFKLLESEHNSRNDPLFIKFFCQNASVKVKIATDVLFFDNLFSNKPNVSLYTYEH